MIDPVLRTCLQPLLRRHRHRRLWLRLALVWSMASAFALVLLVTYRLTGWAPNGVWPGLAGVGALVALALALRRRWEPDARKLASELEGRHPELEGRLLTAVQQEIGAKGELTFLQDRLVHEVLRQGGTRQWARALPRTQVIGACLLQLLALACFGGLLWTLSRAEPFTIRKTVMPLVDGVQITPGDVELERGQNLVVMAQFGKSVPDRVELIMRPVTGQEKRMAMIRSRQDRVFGVTVPGVLSDLSYALAYGETQSPQFTVRVFEYPRLEKSDVELVFPDYTGRSANRIEDTRRVSAVAGADLTLSLLLNKPVVSAELIDQGGVPLSLTVSDERPAAVLQDHRLETGGKYTLVLVDAEGRTNRAPAQFVFDVLENRLPELKLTRPRGDLRPSALEEIVMEGTAWDDFGMLRFGLGWGKAGEEPEEIELGAEIAGGVKEAFEYELALEETGVSADDLILWYLWAEDIGPDEQPRWHTSDLFFGEIRPFEEIFREGQSQSGQSQSQQQGQGEGQQSPTQQLAELQKEIINATWNLRRDHRHASPSYESAAKVVRDSQVEALAQAETATGEANEPRLAALWRVVEERMDVAVAKLEAAVGSVAGLTPALGAEQGAYQALLQLREHEFQVTQGQRSQSRSRGSAGQQSMQRQLDELELTQSENRYETERQAEDSQQSERSEDLQILSRLKELARRQQDLNERLQELQTALQAAEEETVRDQLRRELKRLQEEEQQMMADLDELQQRMEQPENQSRMAEQRQQLEQAREDMRQASEAARRGEVSQALASGRRAQGEMESLRDSLRQESASAFAGEMRDMRAQARELAREQEAIREELDTVVGRERKVLDDTQEQVELRESLTEQTDGIEALVRNMTRISVEAEIAEPLAAGELYDALRDFTQDEVSHVQELREGLIGRGAMTMELFEQIQEAEQQEGGRSSLMTGALLDAGYVTLADDAEARARAGVEVLREGVEQAAERILGDDTEELRRARQQLEAATETLEREMAQAETGEVQPARNRSTEPGGQRAESTDQAAEESPSEVAAEGQSGAPGAEAAGEQQTNHQGGGGDGEVDLDRLLGETSDQERSGNGQQGGGPITGGSYGPWADRLREAEELVGEPALRNRVASARERARAMRQEYRRAQQAPDWAVVSLEIVGPLVEVRQQIQEELARRDSDSKLTPVDRDPVPGEYEELVRRYYEDLGKN